MRSVKSLAPDKPFFIYFAPGATHAPHHVPKAWIAKYKGKFDARRNPPLERLFRTPVLPANAVAVSVMPPMLFM
ncbi:hypothetical protein [Rhizobium ruizarguesonis]|uniref:hypothetical protein n=1 Tax=Rhizobium ruizarguesonis TaxID=2081791 RepID=UPI0037C66A24